MQDAELSHKESTTDASERLRNYDCLKLELGSLIRRVLGLINEKTNSERLPGCRGLLTRLAEDRFTLAVVGQFNRGKSSLMNAILGLDRLPVGVVPLTSVITKVSYGNPERVLVEFTGSSLRGEIAVAELTDYVTETGNPGNQKRIAAVEVQLPSEFLRRGLFFVDTLGVGSAIAANTATTEKFLPEADAVIFVTSFDSPLGRYELEFLRKVREHVRKVFFVANKLDLVAPEQRNDVLAFIRSLLQQEVGLLEPRLFAVSALVGLQAKLTGSARGLAESGLPALEGSLVEFLTVEKSREFLLRMCDRILSLLGDLDQQGMQGEQAGTLEDLATRVVALRNQILGRDDNERGRPRQARAATRSRTGAKLTQAVRRPCQVCTKVAEAMMKFMAKFQYQIIINENERSMLASRGGLCPLHTWQYAEIASPQGVALAYPAVLLSISRRLDALVDSGPDAGLATGVANLLVEPEICRACQEQLSSEERLITEIVERAAAEAGQGAGNLPALCLPHLSALLRKAPSADFARTAAAFEAALLERLAENMERHALKHDALRRGLASEDERIAYHRGLSQLVGDKRLRAPWRVEYFL